MGSPDRLGFYGMPSERNGLPGPTQRAGEIEAPILALQAGDDQNITAEHNAEFDAALTAAGVEHEVVTYPGPPQLLRPQVRGVRCGLGRRVGAHDRLYRTLQLSRDYVWKGFRTSSALVS